MPPRSGVGGGGLVLGEKSLGIALKKKKKKTENFYSSFMSPLKFPLPREAFLISKDCYPVLPLGIQAPDSSLYKAPPHHPITLRWVVREGFNEEATYKQT